MSPQTVNVIFLSLLLLGSVAIAEDALDWNTPGWQLNNAERRERLEALAAMSEAERQSLREQRKATRQVLTSEEKQVLHSERKTEMAARKADWQALSPEEQEAKKAEQLEFYDSLPADQKSIVDEMRVNRKGRGQQRASRQ